MTEIEKYERIYNNPEKYKRYGHSNHGSRSMRMLDKWNPESMIDVGCGFNEFVESVRDRFEGIKAVGVDFACHGADIIAKASELPFKDKQFDLATSFDMLEHLLPEEVDGVIREMARVSARFCVGISYAKSVYKVDGETLHPTVRNEEWWMLRLVAAGAIGIKKYGRYIYGTWSEHLKMKSTDSVILVGNGPSVLSEERGEEIDKFDHVIRFNNYSTEGFEEYVGNKTTLWSTHFRGIVRPDAFNRVISIHEKATMPDTVDESFLIPSVFYNYSRKLVQDRVGFTSGFRTDPHVILATSGFIIAHYLLEIVGVEKVSLVGFDHFSKENSRQHHYWVTRSFGKPREHNGDVESIMFAELEAAGRIEYL